MPATQLRRRALVRACGTALAVLVWPTARAAAAGTQEAATETHMQRHHAAAAQCDWDAALTHATHAMESAAEGEDAWLAAVTAVATARYRLWLPEGSLELIERAVARAERREQDGPGLTLNAQRSLCELELLAIHELQGRGRSDDVIRHASKLNERLRGIQVPGARAYWANGWLSLARTFDVMGIQKMAPSLLEEVRDTLPGSEAGAIASVLLQQGPDGIAAYRGRYEGDAAHAERMRELRRALPRAAERVAAALGIDAAVLKQVPVGVVDRIEGVGDVGAITLGDPRKADLKPVIAVLSQPLARGALEPEEMLAHELGHAALLMSVGLRTEVLPPWLVEGIVQAVAAPWDGLADRILASALLADPARFVAPDFRTQDLVDFDDSPCATPRIGDGLGLWPLESAIRRQGWGGVVAALSSDLELEAAVERAFGEPPPAVEAREREIARRLELRRSGTLPALAEIVEARASAASDRLARAERVLGDDPQPLARGFALSARAEALLELERFDESAAAYSELIAMRWRQPFYSSTARAGLARCLIATGRLAEAERELVALERDLESDEFLAWTRETLRTLRAARAR